MVGYERSVIQPAQKQAKTILDDNAREYHNTHFKRMRLKCGKGALWMCETSVDMKVLLVSPLPPPKGGIATWTERFVEYSKRNGLVCEVVNTAVTGKRAVSFSSKKELLSETVRTLRILKKYSSKLRRFAPDVVHINTSCSPMGLMRDFLCMKMTPRNIKIVLHCHCTVEDQLMGKKWGKIVFSKVVQHADKVLVLNDASMLFVRKVTKKDAVKIPNCVSDDYIRNDKKLINDKIQCLIYTGHIMRSKGLDEIIYAAKRLPEKIFILAGIISDEYKECELPANIIMAGNLDASAVCEQLDMADVFLFPSYTEGFSNSLAEAMARGLPVITTKVGANVDMLEDRGGIYVPVGNGEAVVEAIEYLEAPEVRHKMSEWNIEKVKSSYCIESVMLRLTELYEDVIEE